MDENALAEVAEKLCEEIVGGLWGFVEIVIDIFMNQNRRNYREDWEIPIKQEIRPLYLDKRRKVHRCRNNC